MNDNQIEELNKKITELEKRLELFEVLMEPNLIGLKNLEPIKGKLCFALNFL